MNLPPVILDVPASARGTRLDHFLTASDSLATLTRSRLQKLISAGDVSVDARPARAGQKLRGGERIEVRVPDTRPLELAAEPLALEVLFEDHDVIAINKPAGIVVHPGAGHSGGTLVNALLAHCDDLSGIGGVARPGIVHRLDRDTTGVLIIAKNDRAHEALARQFANREIEKRYVAFVLGEPRADSATIDTLYGRHPKHRKRFTGRVSKGKRALTTYRVVRAAHGVAELDVLLGTGRTHQIRVHLSEHGHPIVGDATYGGEQLARVKDAQLRAMCAALGHQALHAASLSLAHPTTQVPIRLVAPLPPELVSLRSALGPPRA